MQMKGVARALALGIVGCSSVVAGSANPLGKVLSLLGELTEKINADGEAEAKAYHEYVEWCEETSANTGFAIQSGKTQKGKLEAKIGEHTSDISVATDKVGELAAAVSSSESELTDATAIRNKEAAEFVSAESELVTALDAVGRAIKILSKEMAKNPASFAQMDSTNMAKAMQAIGVVLEAASFSHDDHASLLALVQSQQSEDADEDEMGAPSAAAYKSHSSGIVNILEDAMEKGERKLKDLRKDEVTAQHNFNMLKASLEAQKQADVKDMEEEKSSKSASEESLAEAQGDLEVTTKELNGDISKLEICHSTCMQVAADHETTVAARKEELATIAQAEEVLKATSSGAVSQTYSLLQMRSHSDLVGSEVIAAVRFVAKQQHSPQLAQLAKRITSELHSRSKDPFGKVKGLIQDMIAKLEKEASDDATEKAYCDEQMAKTAAKKGDLEDDIAKMTSRIDQAVAKSAQLKEDLKELENHLAALAKESAELDQIAQEYLADYRKSKSDLELGLTGVRKALEILQGYYGGGASMLQEDPGTFMQQPAMPEKHTKSGGAGGGIIDILQVVEGDFAKNLAKLESQYDEDEAKYNQVVQENKVSHTMMTQDVKYKTKELASLDTVIAEYSADRETANTELSAVLEYFSTVKERCIAKPETYEARAARRASEISGLKKALSILEDDASFVQRKRRGSFLGRLSMVN